MENIKKKLSITFFLLCYTFIAGLLFPVPKLPILEQTIRGLYFHVPMWFGMIILFFISFIFSIQYLRTKIMLWDKKSTAFAQIGMLYGILGLATGMIWAQYTWGNFWSGDPKQNCAAICLLIYFAYFILQYAFAHNTFLRAKMSNTYNIIAFVMSFLLLFILPRLSDSLHPGNGGNPGFNIYDLDGKLRWIFYPSVIGWVSLGIIIANILSRYLILKNKLYNLHNAKK